MARFRPTSPAAAFPPVPAWSRARTAELVDELLARLPGDDPERREAQARAGAYSRDCGCGLGGAFLGGAVLLVAGYVAATGDLGARTLLGSVLALFLAASLGKLTGILVASVRLALLHRSLARHLRRGRSGHVHVH